MEIPNSWRIQKVFADKDLGFNVSSNQLMKKTGLLRVRVLENADSMLCLKVAEKGKKGISPTIYKKVSRPGRICKKCHFNQSGTTGCVLK